MNLAGLEAQNDPEEPTEEIYEEVVVDEEEIPIRLDVVQSVATVVSRIVDIRTITTMTCTISASPTSRPA